MAKQKKLVMPLAVGTKLRNPTCIHDRAVRKAFEFLPTNRLDHKELIMFGTLQDLSPKNTRRKQEDFTGHYYLIVLNLKAERFEVMDSLRSKGTHSLMSDSAAIIGAIKHLWALNYSESKIDISKWRTEYIDTPKQKTSHDCGYFMLKFIEYWDGRRMVHAITQAEMATLRKLLMKKWLDRQENLIAWHDLLFPN